MKKHTVSDFLGLSVRRVRILAAENKEVTVYLVGYDEYEKNHAKMQV
jgi:hypothetical protein